MTHPEQHLPCASSSSTPFSDRSRCLPFFFDSPSSVGSATGRIDKCMIVVAYGLSFPSSKFGLGMCVGSLSSESREELAEGAGRGASPTHSPMYHHLAASSPNTTGGDRMGWEEWWPSSNLRRIKAPSEIPRMFRATLMTHQHPMYSISSLLLSQL